MRENRKDCPASGGFDGRVTYRVYLTVEHDVGDARMTIDTVIETRNWEILYWIGFSLHIDRCLRNGSVSRTKCLFPG